MGDHHLKKNRTQSTAIILGCVVLAMLGFSYASVPLYRLFCQKTGYGGTPKIAQNIPTTQGNAEIIVRFNADVDPNLPWSFIPLQKQVTAKVGGQVLAFYKVKNNSDQPIYGMATYNVTPDRAASYFNKIQCFCFEEQRLEPHQEVDMPVLFFIDPEFAQDSRTAQLKTITLSYTFFKIEKPKKKK